MFSPAVGVARLKTCMAKCLSTLKLSPWWLLACVVPIEAQALGKTGHRVVAELAENHLTAEAKAAVHAITGGKPLASIANWPDFIRSDPAWDHAAPWHYVSVEDDETVTSYKPSKKGDILQALARFEQVLRNPNAGAKAHWEALAFYTHLVGDIHQPLHVGRAADWGGNKIELTWLGEPSNLHAVWDSGLIDHEQLSYTEYVAFLSFLSAPTIAEWQGASYLDWARESKALRPGVYQFGKQEGRNLALGWEYNFHHKPTINERMQQAGIRLAGKLNDIFAKQ
ncbi:S1/P1 nuclease [Simiduia sp. 21SJ11W-1]|uniref:S1/P1 nuclease n=1 Tax=Simiduia sp. 21SJ11W-1 TaxID=2909669 RepID=UPI0020A0319C|nr:S1/P1 nuclease [Simiduia sp. 21SJ11W-1]UTA48526.1 S1/P1 nuclease [Simiduia sp. 21SJ11W-1]